MPPPPPMMSEETTTNSQQHEAHEDRSLALTFASSNSTPIVAGPFEGAGAWKRENTLEIFGRKVERDKTDLNKFSFELSSTNNALMDTPENAAEAEREVATEADPATMVSANTQRFEDDDDVMMADGISDEEQDKEEEEEDEKERRFFATAPRFATDATCYLQKAEDAHSGSGSERGIDA